MPYTKRQSTVGDFPTPSPFVDRTVRAKAKLDFIKFTMPYKAGRGSALANELSKWHSKKQLYMPKKGTNDSLTLHDPKPAQLKFLVDHCPEAHVTAIEVAIDFFPVGTPKTKTPLAEMHRYLTHGLFPTGFALLAGATRKVFLPATGKMKRDPLKARVKANTTYWWNRARTRAPTGRPSTTSICGRSHSCLIRRPSSA